MIEITIVSQSGPWAKVDVSSTERHGDRKGQMTRRGGLVIAREDIPAIKALQAAAEKHDKGEAKDAKNRAARRKKKGVKK